MIVVAGPPGSGKSAASLVDSFDVDSFNADDQRAAEQRLWTAYSLNRGYREQEFEAFVEDPHQESRHCDRNHAAEVYHISISGLAHRARVSRSR